MSSPALNQAIELIKAGQPAEAQKLLEPLLEADPHNLPAWFWYVETWPTAPQKIKALELCQQHNPEQPLVQQALASLQTQSASRAESSPPDSPPATAPAATSVPASTPSPPAQKPRRNFGLWLVILPLVACAACLITFWMIRLPKPNRNALAIGATAKSADLELEIQPPAELDFISKAEVLQLRSDAIRRYPDLIVGNYQPSDSVFGQIEDNRPWWGVTGHFYSGPGEESIEGSAEETRFLLNPYLLVGVEFDGLFYSWDTARINDFDLNLDFPFYCEAEQLRWFPSEARAEVTYNLSHYLNRLNQWTTRMHGLTDAYFSLIAYNARDLNLNYIYVSYADSVNISKPDAPTAAYANPQYLHRGGSCGYPGGCNNMSPDTPEISFLNISALPAQAVVRLWRQRPRTVEQPPDMIFVIHFK